MSPAPTSRCWNAEAARATAEAVEAAAVIANLRARSRRRRPTDGSPLTPRRPASLAQDKGRAAIGIGRNPWALSTRSRASSISCAWPRLSARVKKPRAGQHIDRRRRAGALVRETPDARPSISRIASSRGRRSTRARRDSGALGDGAGVGKGRGGRHPDGEPARIVMAWFGLIKIGAISALINTQTAAPLAHSLTSGRRHHSDARPTRRTLPLGPAAHQTLLTVLGERRRGRKGPPTSTPRWRRWSLAPIPRPFRDGLTCADKALYITPPGTTGMPKAAVITIMRMQVMMQASRSRSGRRRRT